MRLAKYYGLLTCSFVNETNYCNSGKSYFINRQSELSFWYVNEIELVRKDSSGNLMKYYL